MLPGGVCMWQVAEEGGSCSPGSTGTVHLLERVGLLGNLCLGRFDNMRQTAGLGDEGAPGGWSVTAKDWAEAR